VRFWLPVPGRSTAVGRGSQCVHRRYRVQRTTTWSQLHGDASSRRRSRTTVLQSSGQDSIAVSHHGLSSANDVGLDRVRRLDWAQHTGMGLYFNLTG